MLSLQEENLDSIASVALVSDEGQTNERELLLQTLLSEKASEASLKRTFTAVGKECDDAFAEFRKARYKHSVLHSKHKQIQSELEKKSIMVKLIQDAYSKAGSESDLVVGTNSKCCGEGEVVKNGEEVVPNTHYEMKETVNEDLEFADTAECTDEELLDLLRETEKNLSKDGVAAVGGQSTSVTKEKQNEEHTGKKNGPTVQANEKHSTEAAPLPANASPAKKKRLIVQDNDKKNGLTVQANEKHSSEGASLPDDMSPVNKQCLIVQANEKHSSEAAPFPGVVGRARNRKAKENQSSEGTSLPAIVSPPRNPPKKKNVSI
jgi:hypothetical protein